MDSSEDDDGDGDVWTTCVTMAQLTGAVRGGESCVELDGGGGHSRMQLRRLADAIGTSGKWELRRVSMRECGIGDADVQVLAGALATCERLVRLELAYNRITSVGAAALARMLGQSRSLRHLDVSYNSGMGDAGGVVLAEAVRNSSLLRSLTCDNGGFSDVTALAFARALERNKSLRELSLSENRFSFSGALALIKAMLGSFTLDWLYVDQFDATHCRVKGTMNRAFVAAKAVRPTLALLMGRPLSPASPVVLWRRFILEKDGDHAIWTNVFGFLVEAWSYDDDDSEFEDEGLGWGNGDVDGDDVHGDGGDDGDDGDE